MALDFKVLEPDRDYQVAASLINGDPLEAKRSPDELERLDTKIPSSCMARSWVVSELGEPAAIVSLLNAVWDVRKGGCLMRLHLAPSASLSVLRSCYSFLFREAKARRASYVTVWTRDDSARRGQFLTDHGFKLVKRHAVTRIKVDDFIAEPYFGKAHVLKKQGVEFCTAADLSRQGLDHKRLIQEGIDAVLREEYGFQGGVMPPYEKFYRRAGEAHANHLDTSFCAMHEGKIIGFTRLFPSEAEPGLWRTGLTGVLPSWRHRKVGTSIKVQSLVEAKKRGVFAIQTDNAEDNPMLHLNLRLGFERVATLLEHEVMMPRVLPKDLREA
jgi:GNAT superfamily N-acetyltransferase